MNARLRLPAIAIALLGAFVAANAAQPARPMLDAQRGALLYEQACGECHTTQAHWRDKHLVKTWPELLFQVERWQRVAGRGWSPGEMEDVAAFLNRRFYRLPCPVAGCDSPA